MQIGSFSHKFYPCALRIDNTDVKQQQLVVGMVNRSIIWDTPKKTQREKGADEIIYTSVLFLKSL